MFGCIMYLTQYVQEFKKPFIIPNGFKFFVTIIYLILTYTFIFTYNHSI